MQQGYLLSSKTAEKYYFEYAMNLPMVVLWPHNPISDKVYNNITESFVLNNKDRIDAMREAWVDEKYVTGDASDFEKFKAFCKILPNYIGNHTYYFSHIELLNVYGCELDICEENAELIWNHANAVIEQKQLTERKIFQAAHIINPDVMRYEWILELWDHPEIDTWDELEKIILEKIHSAHNTGVRICIIPMPEYYLEPNKYIAGEALKAYRANSDDIDIGYLYMQIFRTISAELNKLGWYMLIENKLKSDEPFARRRPRSQPKEILDYLERSGVLPNYNIITLLPNCWKFKEHLRNFLEMYSKEHPLGNIVFTFDLDGISNPFAHFDYCRRMLCDIVAANVEAGHYTKDEATVKKLIEDVLYNNLKVFT